MSLDIEVEQLEQAIRALEAQRAVLGDAILDTTLAPMLARLAALKSRAHTGAGQQRKLITVLVTDLSGFTALGEQMDAEDLSALMNNLWQRIDALLAAPTGALTQLLLYHVVPGAVMAADVTDAAEDALDGAADETESLAETVQDAAAAAVSQVPPSKLPVVKGAANAVACRPTMQTSIAHRFLVPMLTPSGGSRRSDGC